MITLAKWQKRILKTLGIDLGVSGGGGGEKALAGASKHGRQRMTAPGWRAKRAVKAKAKAKRVMVRESRRRNR